MDDIAEKIAKLIAKADSTSHPEEADAFMAKAHQLLQEHGLSLLDLGKLASDDPVGVDVDATTIVKSYGWAVSLADSLSRYYGCTAVWVKRHDCTLLSVAGRQSARITFQLMFPFVLRQVKTLARQEFRKGFYKSQMQAMGRVGHATGERLDTLWWQSRAASPSHEGGGLNELVPVDLIRAAIDEAFPNVKPAADRQPKIDHHARQVAKQVSLNQQTPAPASALKLAAQ